ncbi:amidase [Pararhizobium haloflavum]|uniref:amidase n=1 Tax=Pararhizobium haloflavum TaxID=2037914 RepID=UPI000C1A512F|nr:amidase [Pararhizobium haloflavum]
MVKRKEAPEALIALGAATLKKRLESGALRAVDLTAACLEVIARREPEVKAWAWLDSDFALKQAEALDLRRKHGKPIGPLHGLPVGIKDIIDTARIPTENGSAMDKGRVPKTDAFVVERLKQAGAIVMGKTVTTELAFLDSGKTTNPHNAAHTPGGSSSGSAAAVAAHMVPLAIGTQTGGSIIRPASYCGVTGFKPTYGVIPRTGILRSAPTLDTVGVYGARAEDAALLADVLAGYCPSDPATSMAPGPRLIETAASKPPLTPVLAFIRPFGWEEAEPAMKEAVEELVTVLGDQCFEVNLPRAFEEALAQHRTIYAAEMAKCYYAYEKKAGDQLPPSVAAMMGEGKAIPARDYIAALDWRGLLNAALDEVFERCDAIIMPAATGPAPAGFASTGNPVFNGVWTLCGTPAVSLPLFTDEAGMPMGLQMIGPSHGDGRLLRTARWLEGYLAEEQTQ